MQNPQLFDPRWQIYYAKSKDATYKGANFLLSVSIIHLFTIYFTIII